MFDNRLLATITITMPRGTDVTKLTPVIATNGVKSLTPGTGETVDFTNAVTYTAAMEDGNSKTYTVTVYVGKGTLADQFWDMSVGNPTGVQYLRCSKRADSKSCDGRGTLRTREFERFLYGEMVKKLSEFQTLTAKRETVNPKLTALNMELARVEDEIEKLLNTLTGARVLWQDGWQAAWKNGCPAPSPRSALTACRPRRYSGSPMDTRDSRSLWVLVQSFSSFDLLIAAHPRRVQSEFKVIDFLSVTAGDHQLKPPAQRRPPFYCNLAVVG